MHSPAKTFMELHSLWATIYKGCCCPCMEQPTVDCYVIVVTVDFQASFEDASLRNIVLVTLIPTVYWFSVCRTC